MPQKSGLIFVAHCIQAKTPITTLKLSLLNCTALSLLSCLWTSPKTSHHFVPLPLAVLHHSEDKVRDANENIPESWQFNWAAAWESNHPMVALRDGGWVSFPEARKLGFLKTKPVLRSALGEGRDEGCGKLSCPKFRSRNPTVSECRGVKVKTSGRSRVHTEHWPFSGVRIISMINQQSAHLSL